MTRRIWTLSRRCNATEHKCTVQRSAQGVCACVGIFCATHGRNGPIKMHVTWGFLKSLHQRAPPPRSLLLYRTGPNSDSHSSCKLRRNSCAGEVRHDSDPKRTKVETTDVPPTARETRSLPGRIFVPSRTLLPQEAPSGENSWAEI